jgi:hypothetical protein
MIGDKRWSQRSASSSRNVVPVVMGVCLLMILAWCVAMPPSHAISNAAPPLDTALITTHTGWGGWDGNSVIYATQYSPLTYLPAQSSHVAWENATNDSGLVPNALVVSEDGSSGESQDYDGYSYNALGYLQIQIGYTVAGASDQCEHDIPLKIPETIYDYTAFQSVTEAANGLPANNATAFSLGQVDDYWFGLNATTSTSVNTPDWSGLLGLGLAALGLTQGEISIPIAALSFYSALFGLYSPPVASHADTTTFSGPSGSMTQWAEIDNGTWGGVLNNVPCPTPGTDVFAQASTMQINIFTNALASVQSGFVSISAQNQMADPINTLCSQTTCSGSSLVYGATTAPLLYGLEPAVSIGGSVDMYPGGPAATGAQLTLQQSCGGGTPTDFIETIGGSGSWHFFADPGCTYSYTASYNGDWDGYSVSLFHSGAFGSGLTALSQAGTDHESLNIGVGGGEVNFVESGLASGTSWSVTFNGTTESQPVNTITFIVVNGSYSYTVGSKGGYTVSPSGGSVTVSGAAYSEPITFTALGPYTVTMSESGLPAKYSWSASVGSTGESGAAGTELEWTGLSGANSFGVNEVTVGETCPNGHITIEYYVPSPAAGTVTGPQHISVTFTYKTEVTKISCENPTGGPVQIGETGEIPTTVLSSGLRAATLAPLPRSTAR